MSVATRVATGLKWGYHAAVVAVKGVTLAYKGIMLGVRTATDLVTKATRASTDAFAKGKGAIGGAEGAMGKFAKAAGVGLIALEAWQEAWNQNEELKKQTGGLGIGDIAGGMIEQGTWNPFDVVDKHQNALAKAEAAKRSAGGGPAVAAARIADVGGGLDGMLSGVEEQLANISAVGAIDAEALAGIRGSLAAATAAVPRLGFDPGAVEAAAVATERIDALSQSLEQLATAGRVAAPPNVPAAVAGASSPAPGPATAGPNAVTTPPRLTVPREQSQEMARLIGAEVRRALKETPLNVSVDGTAPASAGRPVSRRNMPKVRDSGAP